MRLLNLCAGATRPPEPWTNLDNLHATLAPGTPERAQLDSEKNYVNWDIEKDDLPFQDNVFSAILASHCIEHFSLLDSVEILKECRRILIPGGFMVVSVPDATVFRENYRDDTPENAVALFGEPIFPGEGSTFMQYAGFNRWHLQLFSADSLWCVMTQAGLSDVHSVNPDWITAEYGVSKTFPPPPPTPFEECCDILNRLKFSLVMVGVKP